MNIVKSTEMLLMYRYFVCKSTGGEVLSTPVTSYSGLPVVENLICTGNESSLGQCQVSTQISQSCLNPARSVELRCAFDREFALCIYVTSRHRSGSYCWSIMEWCGWGGRDLL